LEVELAEEGERRALPAGLDLSAYRVIQEALTNTLKHSGAGSARVTIRYGSAALEIEVVDRGASNEGDTSSGAGQGLVGMRERVAMFGGTLEAGAANGGFRIRAVFPIPAGKDPV